MSAKSILVVDDEAKILEAVTSYLESRGYSVHAASSGRDALAIFEKNTISLVVLDLMLPDMSGEEVCAVIRSKSRVPIIMLTARTQETDMLSGLALGADDYITKPFSLKVLCARMETVLRRASDELVPLRVVNSWHNGDLVVDLQQNVVLKKGESIGLTHSERKILTVLMAYPSKVFTREELIEVAFDEDFDGYSRVIDTHIKNLRRKLEDDPKSPTYILTIHGLGYRFGGK